MMCAHTNSMMDNKSYRSPLCTAIPVSLQKMVCASGDREGLDPLGIPAGLWDPED